MTTLPRISSYGNYSSANYGVNTIRVDVGTITVWYSYRTPVAFQVGFGKVYVRENNWGPTTGKHLNWIDDGDKGARLSSEAFEAKWDALVPPALSDAA